MAERRVGIVGGGIAGLCAALEARAAGAEVVVLEAMQHLGGRAGGGEGWDTGRHLATSAYSEFFWLLDQLGTRDKVILKPLALGVLLDKRRPYWHFHHPLFGSLAAATTLLGSSLLPFGSRFESLFAVLRSLKRALPEPSDDELIGDGEDRFIPIPGGTVADLFEQTRWPKAFARRIGRPLARSVFNLSHEEAAEAPFVTVLKRTLEAKPQRAGWVVGGTASLISEPAPAVLAERGVQVRLRSLVSGFEKMEKGWRIHTGAGGDLDVDAVVFTAPFNRLGMLTECEPLKHLADATAAGKVEGRTIVTCRARVEGVDPAHGPLAELSEEDPAWFVEPHPEDGVLLERVVSGLDSSTTVDRDGMAKEFVRLAAKYFRVEVDPGAVEIKPYIHATPSLKPGLPRPVLRQAEGFYYASDWSATGLPATMESAARAGRAAGRAAANW